MTNTDTTATTVTATDTRDPRILAENPLNPRVDLGDLAELTASIASVGILQPLVLTRAKDGTEVIVAGHRRCAAAIAADLTEVPVILREDLAAGVDQVAVILAENGARSGLSVNEQATAVQSALDLGATMAGLARRSGINRKTIAKAAGVSKKLDTDVREAIDQYGLTLDQAAALAEYADQPAAVARMLECAASPGQFAAEVKRAKAARDQRKAVSQTIQRLTEEGLTAYNVEDQPNGSVENLWSLATPEDPHTCLTEETHHSCPGRAFEVSAGYYEDPDVTEVCLDWATHGHIERTYPSYTSEGTTVGGDSDEAAEQAKAVRRRTITNNKAMAIANTVRAEWAATYLTRKTAGKDGLLTAVTALQACHTIAAEAMAKRDSDYSQAHTDALTAVGWTHNPEVDGPLTAVRVPIYLAALIIAGYEPGAKKEDWRGHAAAQACTYLTALVSFGYSPTDIEAQIIAGTSELYTAP